MTEEKVDVIPEHIYVSVMPEGNLHLLIPNSVSSTSLVQESDSAMAVTGDIELEGGHIRRKSTGSLDVPYTRVKILSRYLASSAGSCHDYCKYGIRHVSETKPWDPLYKRTMEMEVWQKTNAANFAERKKKPAVSCMLSTPCFKSKKVDDLAATKTAVSPDTSERIILPKRLSLLPNGGSTSSYRGSNEKKKSESSKPSSLSAKGFANGKDSGKIQDNKDPGGVPIVQIEHGRRKQMKAFQDKEKVSSPFSIHTTKKVVRKPNVSFPYKQPSKAVSRKKSEHVKSLKVEADKSNFEEVPGKTLHLVESKSGVKIPRRMKKWDGSPLYSSSYQDKSSENKQNGKAAAQLVSPSAKLLRRARKETDTNKMPTSSIIKSLRRTTNVSCVSGSSRPSSSSLANPMSIPRGISNECDETEFVNKAVDTCVDPRTRKGKGGTTNTKTRTPPVRKLKFREGKIVEIKPEIQNPRRLKFRQRILGNVQNGKAENRKSNLKGIEGEAFEVHVSETEPGKVVMRHQDVQGKKVVQSLLNNVIEETASKLVQTKKSKVKALVGAFETVISLQDSKPVPAANEF